MLQHQGELLVDLARMVDALQKMEELVEEEERATRRRQRRQRREKTMWVRPWLSRRAEYGAYTNLMKELELEDPKAFRNFMRMEPAMFKGNNGSG